ncbi:MLO-like protein 1 [Mangifera indica]|uniref:MLO-like protein 1 n=1 Tax=Mangifera indica TaxID=29780 RepID=UPI001CFB1500|nr:MLO-like protein 1 [Mangifera indica]
MGEGGTTLEYTPTWVVALVCSVIVVISFAVERLLHYFGKVLKKKNQKPLFEALRKIKEELMLLGFISLLLIVFHQNMIAKICISEELASKWLPCKQEREATANVTSHFQSAVSSFHGTGRHILESSSASVSYCSNKGKVPMLSIAALHHLNVFIFVLAVVHVTFCALTILFGGAKIRQWKQWEHSASKGQHHLPEVQSGRYIHVHDHDFIKNRYQGLGKSYALLGWWSSFFKQFYGSVTKSDYTTLRLGFIMTHCRGNPKFNFHNYLMRTLGADFKKVVGISWYLWLFVIIFLLLNVYGWHTYFWIAFVPFILLLAAGTKLEHIITQLAHEVAEKHVAVEGDLVVQPCDDHFWFNRPRIVLLLIHFILFQNSFELSFFFWIWFQYGFYSCIMGQVRFIIPRLVIGAFIQFICSYSTLPLYVIVTQMGSSFKKAIFDEHIQDGLLGWARLAKKRMTTRNAATGSSRVVPYKEHSPDLIQLGKLGRTSAMEMNRIKDPHNSVTIEK